MIQELFGQTLRLLVVGVSGAGLEIDIKTSRGPWLSLTKLAREGGAESISEPLRSFRTDRFIHARISSASDESEWFVSPHVEPDTGCAPAGKTTRRAAALVCYANFQDALLWCERNRQPAAARIVFKHTRHLTFCRCTSLIHRNKFKDGQGNICSAATAALCQHANGLVRSRPATMEKLVSESTRAPWALQANHDWPAPLLCRKKAIIAEIGPVLRRARMVMRRGVGRCAILGDNAAGVVLFSLYPECRPLAAWSHISRDSKGANEVIVRLRDV